MQQSQRNKMTDETIEDRLGRMEGESEIEVSELERLRKANAALQSELDRLRGARRRPKITLAQRLRAFFNPSLGALISDNPQVDPYVIFRVFKGKHFLELSRDERLSVSDSSAVIYSVDNAKGAFVSSIITDNIYVFSTMGELDLCRIYPMKFSSMFNEAYISKLLWRDRSTLSFKVGDEVYHPPPKYLCISVADDNSGYNLRLDEKIEQSQTGALYINVMTKANKVTAKISDGKGFSVSPEPIGRVHDASEIFFEVQSVPMGQYVVEVECTDQTKRESVVVKETDPYGTCCYFSFEQQKKSETRGKKK